MNIRTFWKARTGTNLNKFTKSSETASSVILTNAPDAITEAGTPFTAAAMNSIEERIENNRTNIDAIVYGMQLEAKQVNSLVNVYGMTATASGDVYACVNGGDIYKQTGGAGDFVALSQANRGWRGITSTPSGDVYATVAGGDIYKQSGGTGDFVALSQTNRSWNGITSTASGDVYACVYNGDIYKQSGGTGDFVALGLNSGNRYSITQSPSGALLIGASFGIYALKYKFTPRQNLLINSNFDFWQEATSLSSGTGVGRTSDGGFTASVGTTYTPSRQSFTVGQTAVPNGPRYYKRIVTSSVAGSANYCLESFEAEFLEITANKKISFSVWLKADATKNISVEFGQKFGSGGSSQVNTIGVTKQQISSSWAKYTFTADMPSISGKTFGTTPGSIFAAIWFDAGSNFNSRTDSLDKQSGTFDIAQAKLEIGSFATDWEPYNLADELVKCQRYCEKSYDLDTSPGTASTSGENQFYINVVNAIVSNSRFPIIFKTAKAYSPTVTVYATNNGAANSVASDSGVARTATTVATNANGSNVQYTDATGASGIFFQWIARAYL